MKPIIFLDLDETVNTKCDAPLDPNLVAHITRVCLHTGANIVITSNQRLVRTKEELAENLYEAGLPRSVQIIGTTISFANSDGDRSRWSEIKNWIENNLHPDTPYVIIDDACGGDPPADRLIKVNYKTGMSALDADKAIEVLNGPVAQR